jgi:hypothetical protein
MTNATPPGWYPDPWNPSAQRFWDGGQWTEHVAAANGPSDRPRLPEGAPIYGPIIWVLALLPLVNAITIWFVHIDVARLVDFMQQASQASQDGGMVLRQGFAPGSLYGPGYWVAVTLGWVGYAAAIVLAYFDWKRLGRVGVERPFQWSWAFLTNTVYVIGRSVIVRRVAAPRGLAPIWVLIGAYVVTIVSVSIWSATFLGALFQQLNEVLPTS